MMIRLKSNTKAARVFAVIVCVVILGSIAAAMIGLARRTPNWFRADFVSDAQMESRSSNFEQGLAAQFTKVRGEERVWAIRITENEMNEWLASRLPKWLEFEHPELAKKVGKIQVQCLEDRMGIAAESEWGVGSIEIVPRMQAGPDGNGINLAPSSGAIGELPVPVFIISTFQPTDLFGSLRNSEFRLADGRRVKVKDIEVLPGELRLQLDTSPTKN